MYNSDYIRAGKQVMHDCAITSQCTGYNIKKK